MKKWFVFLPFAFALISAGIPVKNIYTLTKNYMVTIHGTSKIHDWKDSVGKVTGEMVADPGQDGTVDVREIHIKMEVRSIKSDMGSGMDNKTYKALKADANPEILFLLNVPVKLMQVHPGGSILAVKGSLTLAGICKPVTMQVTSFTLGQGKLQLEGSQTINMADFGVKPPTALFGTIRARPQITIQFKTNFTNKQD